VGKGKFRGHDGIKSAGRPQVIRRPGQGRVRDEERPQERGSKGMLIFADGITVLSKSVADAKECPPYDVATVLAWGKGKVICIVKVFLPFGSGKLSFGGADNQGEVGTPGTICDVNADYHVNKLNVVCKRSLHENGRVSPFFSYEFREKVSGPYLGQLLFAVEIETKAELVPLGFEEKAELVTA